MSAHQGNARDFRFSHAHALMAVTSDAVPLPGFEDFLPPQRPTIQHERLDLSYGPNVNVALAIDASPGCGGIAWPAGEVVILMNSFLINTDHLNLICLLSP